MPNQQVHRDAAYSFLDAYFQLDGDNLVPPQAMLLFYSALHLVELVASNEGMHFKNHANRMVYVESLKNSKITNAYQRLSRVGSKGRYNPQTLSNINTGILDNEYFVLAYKPILYWAATEINDQKLVEDFLALVPATV